mgnify:CR=1 FL=1
MTDNRHNNGTADLTHRDIYTVPNGFFEAEKQRLSALARGPWQARRRRNRRLIWGTTATAAAAAIACLVVIRPSATPQPETPTSESAQSLAQASSDSRMYLDMPQEMIDNDLFMNTY